MRIGVFVMGTLGILWGITTARAADVPIVEKDKQFDKDVIKLAAGDALIVTNSDSIPHNLSVIDPDGDPTDTGVQPPGFVLTLKFPNPGKYQVRCNNTPEMRINVLVH